MTIPLRILVYEVGAGLYKDTRSDALPVTRIPLYAAIGVEERPCPGGGTAWVLSDHQSLHVAAESSHWIGCGIRVEVPDAALVVVQPRRPGEALQTLGTSQPSPTPGRSLIDVGVLVHNPGPETLTIQRGDWLGSLIVLPALEARVTYEQVEAA